MTRRDDASRGDPVPAVDKARSADFLVHPSCTDTAHRAAPTPEASTARLERAEWQGEGETFIPTRRVPEARAPEPEALITALVDATLRYGEAEAGSAAENAACDESSRLEAQLRATVAALTAERTEWEQQQNAGGSTMKSEPPTAAAPNQPQEPEPKGEGSARCECASCVAHRIYGITARCCPRGLSHGMHCICGTTVRA